MTLTTPALCLSATAVAHALVFSMRPNMLRHCAFQSDEGVLPWCGHEHSRPHCACALLQSACVTGAWSGLPSTDQVCAFTPQDHAAASSACNCRLGPAAAAMMISIPAGSNGLVCAVQSLDGSALWRRCGGWLDSLRGRGGRRGSSWPYWLCTILACAVLMLTVVGGALSSRPAFQVPCCPLPCFGQAAPPCWQQGCGT